MTTTSHKETLLGQLTSLLNILTCTIEESRLKSILKAFCGFILSQSLEKKITIENQHFYTEIKHYVQHKTYHTHTINSENVENRKRTIRKESTKYLIIGK